MSVWRLVKINGNSILVTTKAWKSHETTGEVGVTKKQSEHIKQRTTTTMTDVGAMANPPTQETSINDKGKKLATAPDIQEVNVEDNRVDLEVTEC